VAAIRAVCEVEAPKGGFNPDGSVATLFEGHKFYKYTNGVFAESHPTLCFKNWTKAHYGKTWQQEQARLAQARALNNDAAMMSASWGKFQIMGFNYETVGFKSVSDFVRAMVADERSQLLAFVEYVKKTGLTVALRKHDWAAFARGYNGPAYAENAYDTKLATAYAKFLQEGVKPDVTATTATAQKPNLFALVIKFLQFVFSKKP
jgi:hypothetical protein